uniref:TSSK6 activating cochaperone n=1 Tax=Felis catus TaxID=9685 RepID=A0ABI7XF18_FELCA
MSTLQHRQLREGHEHVCLACCGVSGGRFTGTRLSPKEESNAVPLCRAKPSPSFINLQASSPLATFLNVRTAKLPSGVDPKPKECLGLLERMYANLQLQTQLTQQQMAILENLQASMTHLAPGRGSKNSALPALPRNLLQNRLPPSSK